VERYSFIKAWRAKIFAKIEWKDTSKNPTQEVKTTPLGMIKKSKKKKDLDLLKSGIKH
jgi:hypothetical protein